MVLFDLNRVYEHAVAVKELQANPVQKMIVQQLHQLGQALLQSDKTSWIKRKHQTSLQGIYLYGSIGSGKTYLMDLFYQHLPLERKGRLHFHEFMHSIHERLKILRGSINPIEKMADQIAEDYRLLCFDELMVIDIADAMILGLLLRALFERGVVMVMTSNIEPDQLYWQGLQREQFLPAIEAIKTHMQVIAIQASTDYRRLKDNWMRARYWDTLIDEQAFMQARFDHLAIGEIAHQPLLVQGRLIPIIAETRVVLWCHFQALCEGPRVVSDYLVLTKRYRVILLSAVPVLTELEDNEARRFIHFIDACYDQECLIFISAAAPLEALYTGKRLAQAFQRTVSRLIEMQNWDIDVIALK